MKYALVTGASKGLGKGFVDALSQDGYTVFAGVRNPDEILPTNHVIPLKLDIGSDISIREAFEYMELKTDCLDIIVNNAGVNKDTGTCNKKELVIQLSTLSRDLLLEMYNINTLGALFVTKAALKFLNNDPSWVINISSYHASFHDEFENSSANYGYRASKIALNMNTFCSVWDLPKNVRTFAVNPGDMKTDMNPDGKEDPHVQALRILEITKNWDQNWNGKFLKFDGSLYPL